MALRSLVVALDRLQSVLLCSFVWRSGNPAKLVALLPYIGSCPRRTTVTKAEQHHGVIAKETDEPRGADRRLVTYGLHLVYLPVAEDMLELRLPSLPSVTPAQLSAVETVVDKLVLPNPPPHVDHNCSLKSNLSSNHEDNKQAPRFAGLGSSLLEGQGLQATVQSPAGWQRNPALEVVAERAICIDSPSPPCSSRTFSSFLPDSIAAYGSASDFFDVRKICNPALQRYYHLLVYRHYRPAPRPPAAAGDGRGGEFQQTSEAEPPEVHRQILPRLWSRSSVGESLFGFEAERGASGKVVSGGLHTERPTDEDCDAALKAAYPLSTAPENQLTVRRQKEAQKKLLFGEVVRKQQQLQLHDIKVSGGDFDVEEDDRRGEQELRDNDAAQEEREREERITALKRLHVGSVNPIRDFRRLLEVKETDLTESAIQEMIDVIWRFLRSVSDVHGSAQESIENVRSQQLLRKAVACVETLREGCSKELEGGKFNEFLRELKAARSKGEYPRDAVSSLWDMLKRNGVGLITNVEDPGVGIQAAERLRVYDDDEHHSHTGSPQEEKARTTDPALADLLDLVE
ncbi:ku70 ku80 beta-barrel domain-containing protein [Cystoisospora suis]|uniref:Ku70 ku80 beta-barrel domain-containing protein n=1 Tax=Cystoisospora suis TaxID=483139 RepID=A0A2C6JF80_9APIC|nr:ku70 ku80 beta-barrel domain-containing protein [Cystoisospora suis]